MGELAGDQGSVVSWQLTSRRVVSQLCAVLPKDTTCWIWRLEAMSSPGKVTRWGDMDQRELWTDRLV